MYFIFLVILHKNYVLVINYRTIDNVHNITTNSIVLYCPTSICPYLFKRTSEYHLFLLSETTTTWTTCIQENQTNLVL